MCVGRNTFYPHRKTSLYKSAHMCRLCYLFFSMLIQVCSSTNIVIGTFGQNVTLPCRYNTHTYGVLNFCWVRGKLPRFGCSNTLLASQEGALYFRWSHRYQLLHRVTDGDISLTILHAQRNDAGLYGCRVEIPGWFNDQKTYAKVVILEDIMTTTTADSHRQDGPVMDFVKTEERFKAALDVGNIGRMVAIFFLAVVVILVFIYRKNFVLMQTSERAETDYESVQMPA
ncbi:hepatitis A virus cellular receptor 1 homolog [Thalassophryne amazonica]|uniref:hepatitis A virus cellular receptor 1 homolog n=1 Tax=Thalassophryne amazonica TaxID=390379 RepID=UPI001470E5C8|nr:hepatitis A virus cellular receptor 1 homolog [Thalassophryne amazonica]XP_034037613.1 hepatitis A virus cellular receptor 1 homolog [Thalassophryne amazonica]